MNSKKDKNSSIHSIVPAPLQEAFSSGGGDGTGHRLSAIESRLAVLEARSEYLATKEDIQSMRADMLKWGIGVLIAGFGSILAVVFKLAE